MLSSRHLLLGGLLSFFAVTARAQVTWANIGTDFSVGANWSGNAVPGSANVAQFAATSVLSQPQVNSALSVGGLSFAVGAGSFNLTGSGALAIGNGIDNEATTAQTIAVPISFSSSTSSILNNGTLTISGLITNNASPTALTITNNGTMAITGGLANNASMGVGFAGNGTSGSVSSPISGAGSVTVNGTGKWTFSGANTYTGATTINGGVLAISADNNLGAAPSTATSGSLTLNGGTLETTASFTLNSNRGIALGATGGMIQTDASTTLSYGGVISGSGVLNKLGGGTLVLSGANTNSGFTVVQAGTLQDGAANALSPSSQISIGSGAALNLTNSESIYGLNDFSSASGTVTIGSGTLTLNGSGTFSGSVNGSGALTTTAGAYQTFAGTVGPTGGTTIQAGSTLQIGNNGTTGALSGTIVDNGTLSFNRTDAITYSGIAGTGGISQIGTGTLILNGSNPYSGQTTISHGTLADAAAGAFSASSPIFLMASGTNLNVNFNESIFGLGGFTSSAGSTTTIASGAALTVKNGGLTYNGTIAGNGALVLTGGGSQTLGGANTYTGGTSINGGILFATNTSGSATGTGTVTVANGATLQLGNSGPGGMVSGNIVDNGNVFFTSTDTTATYGGVISGSGSFSVGFFNATTAGVLTLTGANTYSGFTNIGSGTLIVGAANTLPASTAVAFGSSGILNVANSQTIGRFAGTSATSSIFLGNGKTLTVAPSAGVFGGSFEGTISGTGALTVNGAAGTGVTLDGTNTYAGGTTVNGGALYVGSSSTGSPGAVTGGAVGTGTVTVASGAALAVSKTASSAVTVANNISVASGATLGGASNDNGLILSGTVTVPASTATVHLGNLVQFTGSLQASSGTTALTFDSASGGFGNALFLSAPSASITSITASGAGVIFGSQAAVPTSGLTLQASTGYVGIGAITGYTAPTADSVLNLISNRAAFAGALGFDTGLQDTVPHVFSDNLDLTGFGSGFTLGSESSAVLTGTITPASSGYAFGNGGGVLFIQSALTGPYGVAVASTSSLPGNGLVAVLQGANTYTGNLAVTNSGAILDSATALPAGRTVSLGANGYVGYTEGFTGVSSLADFLAHRLGTYTPTSVIGLDSHDFISSASSSATPSGDRYDSEAIDLSALTSVYFGTMTNLVVNGAVTAPNHGGTLSLLAADEANLVIASPLLAGNVSSVVVGSAAASFGKGTVVLDAANTYAGGTQLQSGTLVVGQDSKISGSSIVAGPVGTGTLTVAGNAVRPILVAGDAYTTLANPVVLGTALQVGTPSTLASNSTAAQTTAMATTGSNTLTLGGVISDLDATHIGSLNVANFVGLYGANTFSGGVNIQAGGVFIDNDAALGTGPLTFSPGSLGMSTGVVLESWGGARTLANNVVYNGNFNQAVRIYDDGGLTINGSVALNNGMSLWIWGDSVKLNGQVTGGGKLTLNSGSLTLNPTSGSNTFSGGLEVIDGAATFASANAIPGSIGSGLTADYSGYIGISFVPTSLQSGFLDKFNKNGTFGTIGLDSPSVSSPNTFNSSIDLRGFGTLARLGSASSAIIASTATITPQSATYNFGGGGGALRVNSALTDDTVTTPSSPTPRSVSVLSTDNAPLTVTLGGSNTYSGATSATNSAIVFASANAVSPNSSLVLNTGGYIGLQLAGNLAGNDPTLTGFLSRFTSAPTQGYVGFDAGAGNTITNLDLSSLGVGTFGLATTSTLDIAGTLTLNSGAAAYSFAGYKGGQLRIDSALTDGGSARSVVIGSTTVAATFDSPVDPNSILSAVTLNGANTYTGGTAFNAGALYLGNDAALGTGTLTIAGNYGSSGQHLGLFATGGNRTIANAIVLNSSGSLDIGGSVNLTLTGSLSGGDWLDKVGIGALTLTGNNTAFAGDLTIDAGSVVYSHGNSVGTGSLDLGGGGGSASFLESSTVNGVSGYAANDAINVGSGTTLTINQPGDSEYMGTIAGSNVGLNFTGTGYHLRLSGASAYTGTNTIGSGIAVVAGNANALGAATNPITINGGKLAVDAGVTLANPITLTSGRLGGSGTFKVPTGGSAFDIKSGVILAPGVGGPGNLTLDGSLISTSVLLLESGGAYNWQLLDAKNAGGWDTVTVNGNVDINVTTGGLFNFHLLSLGSDRNSGFAANFDPLQAYSWTVLTANHINGFTGTAQFNLDTSSFVNPTTGGYFTMSLNGTQTSLLLNFTPVPEPSTYALMLAGAAMTLLVSRRRRRRV